MKDKHHKTIDYQYITRELDLHSEVSNYAFEVTADSPLMPRIMDRSVMVSDTVILWLCHSGSVVASINGTSHTIGANQLLVVLAGCHCRLSLLSSDFRASVFMSFISHSSQVDSIVTTFPRVQQMPVVTLLPQEENTLTALHRYVELASQNYRSPSRIDIDNNILALLRSELIDIFLRRNLAVREATPDEQMVKQFNMMLTSSSIEHRDVEYYAEYYGLTPKRFAAKVKRITGTTPSDLIASAVIRNAKRLLLSTELSSAEISEKLNFSTPSFFCRYFKRYAGMAPQAWRGMSTTF